MARKAAPTLKYNLVLRACALASAWAAALCLLRCMPKEHPPDIFSYNTVLKACCTASRWPRAVRLVCEAESWRPDATSLSTVVAALEANNWPLAVSLLHELRSKAAEPNTIVYGAVLGRVRDEWPVAMELLSMAAQQSIAQNQKTRSAVMASYQEAGHWEPALLLLDAASSSESEPGIFEFSGAASAASRAWPLVFEVLEQARTSRIVLDAVVHNTAITASGRGQCWPLALQTLHQASAGRSSSVRSFRAAMAAVGSAGHWEQALRLLSSMLDRVDLPMPDLECYNEVLLSCGAAGAWEVCAKTLEVMGASRCPPDLRAYGCAARACGLGQTWEQAAVLMENMRTQRTLDPQGSVWNAVAWAHQAAKAPVPTLPNWVEVDLRKENELLNFVRRRAEVGNLPAVLGAIEHFASGRQWLKVAGGRKAALLKGSLLPGDRVVEFGTYMGYSAMLMASRLRELGGGGRVTSCDVNAQTWPFAKELLSWAGVSSSEVQLNIGIAGDWLASGQLGTIDVLLLDHRGTVYQDDLKAAEPHLSPNARVLADNVLLPGAPLFLGFVVGRYDVTVHEVPEFMQPELEDWVLTAVRKGRGAAAEGTADHRELRQWGDKVDEICWASMNGDVNWKSFQDELGPALRGWARRNGLRGPRLRRFGEEAHGNPRADGLSVGQLRSQLQRLGLDSTGPKAALVQRLTTLGRLPT